jgi:hypothetical protein
MNSVFYVKRRIRDMILTQKKIMKEGIKTIEGGYLH